MNNDIQSAEAFARGLLRHGVFDCGLRDCKTCPEHLKAWVKDIEADRTAQRQAGREEMQSTIDELDAEKEIQARRYDSLLELMDKREKRYAALVEAASDALPTWELLCMCAQCEQKQKAIRKALSDLEGK